jgi:hypothetical protein
MNNTAVFFADTAVVITDVVSPVSMFLHLLCSATSSCSLFALG